MPNAERALCSQCGCTVWPTIGSVRRARTEQSQLICTGCFANIKDFTFAGFSYHGITLPPDLSEKLFDVFLGRPAREKKAADS
jgi:hypothetical protein